jgi:hypothetical protein
MELDNYLVGWLVGCLFASLLAFLLACLPRLLCSLFFACFAHFPLLCFGLLCLLACLLIGLDFDETDRLLITHSPFVK